MQGVLTYLPLENGRDIHLFNFDLYRDKDQCGGHTNSCPRSSTTNPDLFLLLRLIFSFIGYQHEDSDRRKYCIYSLDYFGTYQDYRKCFSSGSHKDNFQAFVSKS